MTTKETKAAQYLAKIILKRDGFKPTDKQIKRCIKMHRNSLLNIEKQSRQYKQGSSYGATTNKNTNQKKQKKDDY